MLQRYVKALAYIITLAIILPTIAAGWVIYSGSKAQPGPADCIIVLGCGLYGSTPSPFLMARLDEGIRLYSEGFASKIIVSGGRGPGEDITEAEAMRRYLMERGIPPEDIIMEDRSTSTLTNLRYSQALMEDHGLSNAIVVSNAYHLGRSRLLAGRLGMEATFSGVRLLQFSDRELKGLIREIPAVILSFFVWIPRRA
ncbi:MAG: YdcF family protein [Bacillota bacterium]